MKKQINKLSLNKSTISNLSTNALDQINGGIKGSKGCPPHSFYCPSNYSCTFANTCKIRTF